MDSGMGTPAKESKVGAKSTKLINSLDWLPASRNGAFINSGALKPRS